MLFGGGYYRHDMISWHLPSTYQVGAKGNLKIGARGGEPAPAVVFKAVIRARKIGALTYQSYFKSINHKLTLIFIELHRILHIIKIDFVLVINFIIKI